jgi:diguanylate cyclase (GGDEF)-like protein/PAS domain S-box-containing protein
LTGVTPTGVDPVPMVLGLSSVLLWWAIESSRFLAILPIAKDVIFQSISDGVIVLDPSGRLVEFNKSCQRMFPSLDRSMFGLSLEKIWSALFGASSSRAPKLVARSQELEVVVHEPDERIYQVRFSPIEQNQSTTWKGAVIIITDMTEIKQLQRRLEKHAYYDDLTEVLNRRAFFEQCEVRYAQLKQQNLAFTVILFDIDHFKEINDTFGHHAGDQVLVHVARICKSCLTEDMLFARYGGEEFVLALFGHPEEEGKKLAERLREKIASHPLKVDGAVIFVTSSFGVAGASAGAKESLQTLLCYADEALYEAKRGGRNQVCVFKREIRSEA